MVRLCAFICVAFICIIVMTDAFLFRPPHKADDCSEEKTESCGPVLAKRVAKVCPTTPPPFKNVCPEGGISAKCCAGGCTDCEIKACLCP